ncbi:HDOD domain-containing protein [Psychrobium sp. 1_MG-2023]|uniref:HDOD domain-containing protein n=1 Tax=Psychrobium sp. 1_MG-2023 TaxID=3062624 RepID=UPI000C32A3E5|nr:HDOD domain-containing protein [Psychrobium sp. 1_MG-2023]MDP2561790.1 HDOD domain-containing protein [Psychrobium sp. 1_MG-2023]PKF59727.1 HDOD domain-containing protein [Alteromonadales bacterium alter-6D02]
MNALDYAKTANEVFVLEDSFFRIKSLLESDDSTMDEIGEVIILDPALTATILKLANSPIYKTSGKVDTITKAIMILGTKEVYSLVLTFFSSKAFNRPEVDHEYLDDFWFTSVDTALTIKYLGQSFGLKNAERLFIIGLLHNLGELTIQQHDSKLVHQCACDDISILPWEKQRLTVGFSFGECGARLLELWGFPLSISHPIALQDDLTHEDATLESKLLYIAKRAVFKNHQFEDEPYSKVINFQEIKDFSLNDDVLDEAKDICNVERLELLSILNPSSALLF